jgi:hypothetical protein
MYAYCPLFNSHFTLSVYTGKPSTASSIYLGILNSPENCVTPCYCSISSDNPTACFLGILCCLFVKWPTTCLGHTTYRYSLHTTTSHSVKCWKWLLAILFRFGRSVCTIWLFGIALLIASVKRTGDNCLRSYLTPFSLAYIFSYCSSCPWENRLFVITLISLAAP